MGKILTTFLIYRIYSRKIPKEMHLKIITDPHISLATNPTNLSILLNLTTGRITSRLTFDIQLVST
jgi:hypothetical protein